MLEFFEYVVLSPEYNISENWKKLKTLQNGVFYENGVNNFMY